MVRWVVVTVDSGAVGSGVVGSGFWQQKLRKLNWREAENNSGNPTELLSMERVRERRPKTTSFTLVVENLSQSARELMDY